MENLYAVCGNHDQMFLQSLSDNLMTNEYVKKYGSSILEFQENKTEKTIKYLEGLPRIYEEKSLNMAMYHGSPWNPLTDYIYPDNYLGRFNKLNKKFILLGQTHYSMNKKVGTLRVINP